MQIFGLCARRPRKPDRNTAPRAGKTGRGMCECARACMACCLQAFAAVGNPGPRFLLQDRQTGCTSRGLL